MRLRSARAVLALAFGLMGYAAAAPTPAPAKIPLLQVSAPTAMTIHAPSGKTIHLWKIEITNTYHAPATAYAVSYLTRLPFRFDARGSRWFDAVPSIRLTPPIAPQGTTTFTVPWHGGRVPTVHNQCVIYADGAVAGNLNLVGHFMSARAVFLAELPRTIARLDNIAHDPGANRTAVIDHFQQQSDAERRLLHTFDPKGKHPRAPARVAQSIVATFTDSHRNVQAVASVLAQTMTRWQAQLATSLPRLPAIAFPPVH